jgi:hypothetical protein
MGQDADSFFVDAEFHQAFDHSLPGSGHCVGSSNGL